MEKFVTYNPTKLFFGKQSITALSKHSSVLGKKVLLMMGGSSAKKNGAYHDVMQQLKSTKTSVVEFWGIKPNPRIDEVIEAIKIGRKEKVDFIVAMGGGSVIDSSKIAALCIPENAEPWQVMKGEYKPKPKQALPLVVVLTIAATGSEMNCFAVLQNMATKEKIGFGSPLVFPTLSICDPTYTLTVPVNNTAYGMADIAAHALEAYFGEGDAILSDRFVVSILKELIDISVPLLHKPDDYSLRERMMWVSTCALNGTTTSGRKSGDWGAHDIAHHLSVLYDIPHGASLSVVYPAWLKLFKKELNHRITWLGKEVFNVNTASATINCFISFFNKINCPVSLSSLGITGSKYDAFKKLVLQHKPSGTAHPLNTKQLSQLIEWMK